MVDVRAAAKFFAPGRGEIIADKIDAADVSIFFVEGMKCTDPQCFILR